MKRYAFLLCFTIICSVLLTSCSVENNTETSTNNSTDTADNATKAEFFTYIVDLDGNAVITGYNGNEMGVVIPSSIDGKKVVAIGEDAFKDNSLIGKVTIPNTVISIGDDAFENCYNLLHIDLPESVVTIGGGAFMDCSSLSTVTLPSGLREMGYIAFARSGLTKITIPATLRHDGLGCWFEQCSNLKSVVYEEGTTEVWLDDFKGGTGADKGVDPFCIMKIKSMTIPESVNTFRTCSREQIDDISSMKTMDIWWGLSNCEIEEIHTKKGSFAGMFFEEAKLVNKFISYQVYEDYKQYLDAGYERGDGIISDTFFKNSPYSGTVIYE